MAIYDLEYHYDFSNAQYYDHYLVNFNKSLPRLTPPYHRYFIDHYLHAKATITADFKHFPKVYIQSFLMLS